MWIGTRMGLYRLDKKSGDYQYVNLPVVSHFLGELGIVLFKEFQQYFLFDLILK